MCNKNNVNPSAVDCNKGRQLGCNTFCCRLLVRLDPEEYEATNDGTPAKGFVDKDEDGNCIHFDSEKELCTIWDKRPRVCRQYECNSDFLLQVVLKHGFSSIGKLSKQALSTVIPNGCYTTVPLLDNAIETEEHNADENEY